MKVLTLSDSPCMVSGLAKVHKHVIDGLLENGHTVEAGCWWLVDEDGWKVGLTPHEYSIPLHKVDKHTDNGVRQLYNVIKELKPDIILTMGDYWNFWYINLLKMKFGFSFKWVSYLTIDSYPINEALADVFSYMDVILCPSEWGCEVIKECVNKPVQYVPYGVDEEFHELPKAKRNKLREERGCLDKFRAIAVSANTERKNLPAFVRGFSEFAKGKDDVTAYVHTDLGNPLATYNLEQLAKRYGAEDTIKFSDKSVNSQDGISLEALNEEYNSSDVLVCPSLNEGFGLPVVEAMQCGVLPIVNDCTSVAELVGPGLLVKNRKEIGPQEAFINYIDIEDLKDKLERAYKLWKAGKMSRRKCRKFSSKFQWDIMKKKINEVITELKDEVIIPLETLV